MTRWSTLLVVAVLIAGLQSARADVFASGLKISDASVSSYASAANTWDGNFDDGSGVKIWFIINESGVGSLSATVYVKQGLTTVKTIAVPSPVKGVNSVIWDGTNDGAGNAAVGTYTFEVVVSDPTGHSTFDSMWVAGASYAGTDFDGGTSYAYRGVGAIGLQSSGKYGNIYVARGTSSANGLYELNADGSYNRKIATDPSWPASVPNEVYPIGSKIAAIAGYGFTGGGFIRAFETVGGTRTDSVSTKNTGVRGLFVRIEGSDTVYYYAKSGSGLHPQIVKITGSAGDTVRYLDMAPYITAGSAGYLKSVALDDDGNCYVAYGDASASRRKLAKFNSSGTLQWSKDASTDFSLTTAYMQALALYRGANTSSAADDKLYVLVNTTTASASGIYSVDLSTGAITLLVALNGVTTAATSQIINVDAVGNVVWSNGGAQERVVAFSPANGANSSTTVSPTGADIVVTTALPVQLVAFAVKATATGAVLEWKTSSEVDNAGFEVERRSISEFGSRNSEYAKVGFVAGAGTSTMERSYSFTDAPAPGRYAYRLKQVDRNGTATYHGEVEIEVGTTPKAISLGDNYPNPFNPSTTIEFSVEADGPATLVVYDMAGREVASLFNGVARAGFVNRLTFDARTLASGMYVYRLQAGGKVLTKRMLLVK